MPDATLTDAVKALALELGADLVGIASADRYANAPLEMSPEGHLPGAKCVVVIAIHHPDAAVELGGERDGHNDPHHSGPYDIQMAMNTKLECISFQLARFLEDSGHRVVAIPATNVWRFRPRMMGEERTCAGRDASRPSVEPEASFVPDLSNIHAAVAAGLGEIGFSGLFLSPEYGPRQRLCCLVTDADLEPTPLYNGPALCDRCMECLKWCPTDAFEKETCGEVELEIGGKVVRYCRKNKWRCSWAEHFGLDLSLPKPAVIDEQVILEQLAIHGRHGGEMGSCLRFCMPPHLRLADPDYCRPYRRRRRGMDPRPLAERAAEPRPPTPDRPATEHVYRLLFDLEADLGGVALAEHCQRVGLNLRDYLPDAHALVAFGIRFPEPLQTRGMPDDTSQPEALTASVLQDWLAFMQLDVCRYLESLGYSAVPGTEVELGKAVEAAGLAKPDAQGRLVTRDFGARVRWGCLVTSAYLEPGSRTHPVRVEAPQDMEQAKLDLMTVLMEEGADLVGVADPQRVDELIEQYRSLVNEDDLRVHVVDVGPIHGPVVPEIRPAQPARLRTVRGDFRGARSVLVIGYHFPYENLERAAEAPAQAMGPYSYAIYQVNRWLRYLAVKAVRRLEEMGYRAAITTDLSGSGSVVANPRGPQPDALGNRFAAAAAGLAWIGLHGATVHPEYGVTQRFIAVVTDAPLPADKPLAEPSPCSQCEAPCLAACPVEALREDECLVIGTGQFEATIARWDRLRCEWAKKYALVGAEGPRWGGQTTDMPPPEGHIAAEQIAEALKLKDPIQKHFTCILEGCLKACQCEGRWGEGER